MFSFLSLKKWNKRKKDKIRAEMREQKIITSKEKKLAAGEEVFKQLERMNSFRSAEVVMLYWSTPSELPTHDFIRKWSDKKTFLLPSVHGKQMKMKKFVSDTDMITGEANIREPKTESYTGKVDLVIVPGIAFDKKKNRMGRGKGYYDRFLVSKKIPAYGVCFDFQLLDKVPTYRYDVKMDRIITPSRVVK